MSGKVKFGELNIKYYWMDGMTGGYFTKTLKWDKLSKFKGQMFNI